LVADAESDPRLQQLFRALSQAAERAGGALCAKMANPGEFRPQLRSRLVAGWYAAWPARA